MNLFIVTTKSKSSGHGHFVRCYGLATLYGPFFSQVFFILKLDDDKVDLTNLNTIYTNNFVEFILKNGTHKDTIIFDRYDIQLENLNDLLDFNTIEINDIPKNQIGLKKIINHTPGLSIADFPANSKSKYYIGEKYLLLRNEFIDEINNKTSPERENNIILSFGALDLLNLLPKYIKAALSNDFNNIKVLTSSTNPRFLDLKDEFSSSEKVEFLYDLESIEIINLIKDCKFCLTTASTFALETMCCGSILAIGYTHDNQITLCKNSNKLGIAVNIDNLVNANVEEIYKTLLNTDFTEMFNKQKEVFKFANQQNLINILYD